MRLSWRKSNDQRCVFPNLLDDQDLTHRVKDIMRRFCAALPEDRIIHGADDFDALIEKDRYRKSYKVDSTGATLTYHSSLAILAHYASSLVRTLPPMVFKAYI